MHIRGAHGCTWSPQNLEKQPNRHYEIKNVLNVKPVYEEKTFKYRKESMALDVHKLVVNPKETRSSLNVLKMHSWPRS